MARYRACPLALPLHSVNMKDICERKHGGNEQSLLAFESIKESITELKKIKAIKQIGRRITSAGTQAGVFVVNESPEMNNEGDRS